MKIVEREIDWLTASLAQSQQVAFQALAYLQQKSAIHLVNFTPTLILRVQVVEEEEEQHHRSHYRQRVGNQSR